MELEALESMYCDEYQRIDDPDDASTPGCFSLMLRPCVGDEVQYVGCIATFTYTPTYPETPASFELQSEKGLTDELLEELRGALDAAAEENLGMAHVFTLGEVAKEWLQDHNVKSSGDGSAHSRMVMRQEAVARQLTVNKEAHLAEERDRAERVESERERIILEGGGTGTDMDGTSTTLDTFMEWRSSFDVELTTVAKVRMAEREKEAARAAKGRPTRDRTEVEEEERLHDSVVDLYISELMEMSHETGRIWFLNHSKGVLGGAGAASAEGANTSSAIARGAFADSAREDDAEDDGGFAELLAASQAAAALGEDAGAAVATAVDAGVFLAGGDDDLDDLELSDDDE